jgi:hypothetical protein
MPWQYIPFVLETQMHDQWCWSAVAKSVCSYYDRNTTWTQCTLANAVIFGDSMTPAPQSCCDYGVGDVAPCNQPNSLKTALWTTQNLSLHKVVVAQGAVPQAAQTALQNALSDLQGEVDQQRPHGIRVLWNGGGAHFVVATGYYPAGAGSADWLIIQDPEPGSDDPTGTSYVLAATFPVLYRLRGSWADSYFTQA